MKPAFPLKAFALVAAFATVSVSETERPPDQVALTAARKIEDPLKKIAALRDVLVKFPKTDAKAGIYTDIFRARLKADPTHRASVMGSARDILKVTKPENRRQAYDTIASALLAEHVFLPEAEQYVRRALAAFDLKRYFVEERAQAIKAKRPEPSEEEMRFWFNQNRSYPLVTMAHLAFQRGRPQEARRLLTEVLQYRPMAANANATLGELEAREGRNDKALELLMVSRLSGRVPPAQAALFERLFVSKHGSMAPLESVLDELYKSRFPSPMHVAKYAPSPDRTARTVLAEFYTGSGCPPCAAADLAFDAVLERYSRDEVALVVYHQHIPRPDPMAFPTSKKRFDAYKRGGVPTFVIDGDMDGGGGPREIAQRTYDRINPKIEKRLTAAPSATLALTAARERDGVSVTASVDPISGDKRDLRLHVVLVEKDLRYSGENGIRFHPMVVRSIAGPESAEGFRLEMDKRYEMKHPFNLKSITSGLKAHLDDYEINGSHGKIQFLQKMHEIDANNLGVVAFVQDAGSMAVLQTKYVDLSTKVAAAR